MVKALFALAKYLTDLMIIYIKPRHLCRAVVLQISHTCCKHSFNQTHVLVASNNISLSCLEGSICIITLLNPSPVLIIFLNPSPVLVALKILRDILSFTLSFMINTRPLVGCLESSDRKVKINSVLYRGLLQVCMFTVRPKWMCLVLQQESRTVTQLTLRQPNGLARMTFKSSLVINLVYSYKANQTRFECSLPF